MVISRRSARELRHDRLERLLAGGRQAGIDRQHGARGRDAGRLAIAGRHVVADRLGGAPAIDEPALELTRAVADRVGAHQHGVDRIDAGVGEGHETLRLAGQAEADRDLVGIGKLAREPGVERGIRRRPRGRGRPVHGGTSGR